VCPSKKIVVSLRLAGSCLGVFAAAAWLIFGLATVEFPREHACAQPKAANICSCGLSSTVSQAYCRGKSRQCGRASREVRENELQSRLLSYSQRRG
jgi:hypothetical protein